MKKLFRLLALALIPVFALSGCMKEDIDDLKKRTSENAARIAALEQWKETVNSNISTLQGLVNALNGNDYVTGVTPFDSPAPGGYRITFSKSGEATIWNGTKGDTGATGATGHAPVIGVAEYPSLSGVYYWTLDGEFIESGGSKVPVTGDPGTPGVDGKTPKVAIGQDGYWYISADGTATGTPPTGTGWTNTNVKATGDKGDKGDKGDQGDAIFAANGVDYSNPDFVTFTLADGPPATIITLPKYKEIAINFSQPGAFIAGQEYRVRYVSTGTAEPTGIRVENVPSGWAVSVDKITGEFVITPPANFGAASFGNATVYLDEGNRIAAMYRLELMNKTIDGNNVGDLYYENGVATGVVFRPRTGSDFAGRGLIINIHEDQAMWGPNSQTGAANLYDGCANMAVVQALGRDFNDFPAFQKVHSLNPPGTTYAPGMTGVWFLPTEYEIGNYPGGFTQAYTNYGPTLFNTVMTNEGGDEIDTRAGYEYGYWMSIEQAGKPEQGREFIFNSSGSSGYNKAYSQHVRAFKAF